MRDDKFLYKQESYLIKGAAGVYVPDIVVNEIIFIELKCKPMITKDDIKQFWYYLKCSKYKVGYLINFGSPNGVRIVRRIYDTARKKI